MINTWVFIGDGDDYVKYAYVVSEGDPIKKMVRLFGGKN